MIPTLCLLGPAETKAVSNGDSIVGVVILICGVLDDKPDLGSVTTCGSGLQGSSKVLEGLGSPLLGNVSWNCSNVEK